MRFALHDILPHVLRASLVAVLLSFGSGCIALSARAHVDVVSDVQQHGFQAGVDVGFGYAGKHAAFVMSGGVDTGAPKLGLHDTFDYVAMPSHRVGWRAGFGGTGALIGDPSLFGLRLATLFSLRERGRYSEHEKFGGESSDTLYALSFETTVGGVTRGDDKTLGANTRLGGSAGLGFEIYSLSRMWF